MTGAHLLAWGAVAVLGIAGSALCSGMEIGSYRLNRVRLRLRARGSYAARLLSGELEHLDRLLATLLIANSLFNYFSALAMTELLAGSGLREWSMVLIEVAVLTPVLLVVAESLPKELFRAGADTLTYRLATPLVVARLLLTWTGVLPLVRVFAEVVARRLGVAETAALTRTGSEHVAALMKEAEGALSASQASLVDRALAFHRLDVAQEMVPWGSVVTVRADSDRARVLALLQRSHHTVFPVVDARGRVLGVLRHTDPYLNPDASVASLAVRPAALAPTTRLRDAILRVRESPAHAGIVEGAGGKPIGLVTLKDLVEPLVGRFDE